MKTNIYFIIVTVLVFLVGMATGKHAQPLVQEPKVLETANFSSTPLCLISGAVRATRAGKEMVHLPGIRIVVREEDAPDASWFPTTTLDNIGQQEKVLAVVARPSINDDGWVVFESQRAVLLPRNEIAQLLVNRFGSNDAFVKLMYKKLR
jgi:hypothetical protein